MRLRQSEIQSKDIVKADALSLESIWEQVKPALEAQMGELVTRLKATGIVVRDIERDDPKVLLVAPLSGHHATLLRGTVKALLPHHDVYITDWHNARDVSLADGTFGFDDYVAHVIQFLEYLGPGAHIVAVCQPCVQVLAADQNAQTFDAIFTKSHSIGATVRPTIWPTPILNEGDSLAFDILAVANPDPGSDLTVVIQT